MKAVNIILIVLSAILLSAIIAVENNAGIKMFVKSIADDRINIYYDDTEIGKIYSVKNIEVPGDSILEYYWKGNHIVKGRAQATNLESLRHIDELSAGVDKLKKEAVALYMEPDSLLLVRIVPEDKSSNTTFVYRLVAENEQVDVVHFYGKEYSLEESYRVAAIILYGMDKKYDILKKDEI